MVWLGLPSQDQVLHSLGSLGGLWLTENCPHLKRASLPNVILSSYIQWLPNVRIEGTNSLLEKGQLWRAVPMNGLKFCYDCACMLCCFGCAQLFDLMDRSLPGFSVHGILQAWILEWVPMLSSRGSSRPRDRTRISFISCIAGGFFINEPAGKPCYDYIALQLCLLPALLLCPTSSPGVDP